MTDCAIAADLTETPWKAEDAEEVVRPTTREAEVLAGAPARAVAAVDVVMAAIDVDKRARLE